jgi:hypothetical protein
MPLTGLAHSRSILGLAIGRSALPGDPFVRKPGAGYSYPTHVILVTGWSLLLSVESRTGIVPIRIGITPGQPITRAISSLRQRHIPVLRICGSRSAEGKRRRGDPYCVVWPYHNPWREAPLLLAFMEKPQSLPLLQDVGFGCKLVSLVLPVTSVVSVVRSRLMIGEIVRLPGHSRDHMYSALILLLSCTSRQSCIYAQTDQQQYLRQTSPSLFHLVNRGGDPAFAPR